jgi:peptidoglycan/LPS O-acetylase OafA/YrhL
MPGGDSGAGAGGAWAAWVRRPGAMRWEPALEGLRGLACGMVFLFHLQTYFRGKGVPGAGWADRGYLAEWMARGSFGVPLFFLMSGYLFGMGSGRLEDRAHVPLFYRARLRRLYPAYAVNICILWLCGLVQGAGKDWWQELGSSLAGASYWLNGRPSTINGVAWSLEVELQFYLVAPWLAIVLARLPAGFRPWCLSGLGIMGVWLRDGAGFTDKTLLGNLHFFVGGWLLSVFGLSRGARGECCPAFWDVAAFCLLVGMRWIPLDLTGNQGLLLGWSGVLVVAAFCGRLWRGFLSMPALWMAGAMSYTVYLYHYPILSFLGRIMAPFLLRIPSVLAAPLLGASTLAATGLVCALLFHLFERPFFSRPNKCETKAEGASPCPP